MTATSVSSAPGTEVSDHGPSLRVFLNVFLALVALTVVSFVSARVFHQSPVVSWAIMMAVSCVKATLVISFFMHLIWEANWKYVLTIPATFMSILIMLLLIPDIGRRTRMYSEERWRNAARPVVVHQQAHRQESAGKSH